MITFYTIVPLGAVVALVGTALSFLLTKYLVSPILRLASVTQDIAKGDMSKRVDIQSREKALNMSFLSRTPV